MVFLVDRSSWPVQNSRAFEIGDEMKYFQYFQIAPLAAVIAFVALVSPRTASAQTYTDLHDFNCAIEGCGPTYVSLLAQGRDGNLYGTASFGGTYGFGTVFKMTPAGTMTTLYAFNGTDGLYPYGGLVLGTD